MSSAEGGAISPFCGSAPALWQLKVFCVSASIVLKSLSDNFKRLNLWAPLEVE